MKKLIVCLLLAFLPTLLMAQAAGAHVVRKPKPTAVAPKPAPKPKPKPQSAPKPKPASKQKPQAAPKPKPSSGYSQAEKDRIIQNLINNMVYVAGGTFTMGATSEQVSSIWDNAKPAHKVTLSSFSIGKYEVTQEEWEAVMGSNPSYYKGTKRPVVYVSWDDCQEFIRKLNALTGKQFRLPTEAEWEYAARGGNRSRGYKYSGSDNIGSVVWYEDNSGRETHPVGQKQANELGLYDMSGNVSEWCQDWYDKDYYCSSPSQNPKGPSTGSWRVHRGGSWWNYAEICRVSFRNDYTPRIRENHLGLRLALGNSSEPNTPHDTPTAYTEPTSRNNQAEKDSIIQNLINNMVYVAGGTFTMGATAEQGSNVVPDEKPAHKVTLSSFSIGKYEVTQEEWEAVMGNNPSKIRGAKHPVERVSWDDCQEFIRKLNAMTGKQFRLPTEAEWEFAARGGNHSRGYKYSGSNDVGSVAWYEDNSGRETHPVGQKQENELGLYDMSGNVWEWCQDWYGENYYGSTPSQNPKGPSTGSRRVSRGGSWDFNARFCRVSDRCDFTPGYRGYGLGLRLALEVPETPSQPSSPEPSSQSSSSGLPPVIQNLVNNMVNVAGGTFTMGATSEQGSDAYDNEKPAHKVTLSSFSIGKYEVTQEEWQAVMGSNPSYFKSAKRPVEQVSWDDCQAFIRKLNALTGKQFRLPTEAEWEYAARGGNRSRGYKYSGSDNLDSVAWHYDNSVMTTHPVGLKQANELGLYDMSGNVWEWCQDWWGDYSSSTQTNPKGPSSGSDRVIRGGGCYSSARGCRVSERTYQTPAYRDHNLGLRLAL